jgi:hypothetical protein
MPNGILGLDYKLTQTLNELDRRLTALATQAVLANASSDGVNGSMSITNNAVNNQPAIQFTYTGGGGSLLAQIYQTTAGAVQITGGLQVSGTKNFIMTHPVKPGYLLRHASTESPVNGVEYWGTATLDATGNATVTLPNYFEALTTPNNRAVLLTPQTSPVAVAYTPITNGAFAVKGPAGTVVSWLVKAERATRPSDWPIDFTPEERGTIPTPPATNAKPTPTAPLQSPMTGTPAL